MNEPLHEDNDTTNGDLLDLAAGQLTVAEGVRLRFALLFDRKRAAEYAQLRQLRREMYSLGTVSNVPPVPVWSDAPPAARPLSTPTVTWGKFTMKRGNVLAAYAVLLVIMTGIAFARQWINSGPYAQFMDGGRIWKLSGPFRGKAIVRNAKGEILGQYSVPDGKATDAALMVAVADVTTTIQGAGKHSITDKSGKALGSVEIGPLTVDEIADMNMTSEKRQQELTERYAPRPEFPIERPTHSYESGGMTGMPGLLNAHDRTKGLSWKLLGYAKVAERYPNAPMTRNKGESLTLPAKKASIEAEKDDSPTTQFRKFAPARNAEPALYWALAGKTDSDKNYPIENGWWKTVRQTGTFRGYGKHEIRDESGKLVVTLTVTPLKAK